ncbi:hypothetical protein FB567DRAFT_585913 [Paraphoma chrysanthemicola]|uniref:Myb-like domain-containing protein n=1 Tax=Paraphoma chrysanthemicola TaxID=798071 RepID=A0A8K0REG3_9PLEO|nr:hypothetical protein FB567DRAFT_585913 [Paraphoma chrysanthemicola]
MARSSPAVPTIRTVTASSQLLDRSDFENPSLVAANDRIFPGHAGGSGVEQPMFTALPSLEATALEGLPQRPVTNVDRWPGLSSYWSVTELQDFDRNVAHFGTDWLAIANHMGTKTHTMIKNQYLRLIESGKADLEQVAQEADARRERGDQLGQPPTPTTAPKRRYESTWRQNESVFWQPQLPHTSKVHKSSLSRSLALKRRRDQPDHSGDEYGNERVRVRLSRFSDLSATPGDDERTHSRNKISGSAKLETNVVTFTSDLGKSHLPSSTKEFPTR